MITVLVIVGLLAAFLAKPWRTKYDHGEIRQDVSVYRHRWEDNWSYATERRDDTKNKEKPKNLNQD